MVGSDKKAESDSSGQRDFATTRWSLVLAAGASQAGESAVHLAALCETYWYPLYAYVRRRGHQVDDAQDLTQEFFARLLERNDLAAARRERGRFRSFRQETIGWGSRLGRRRRVRTLPSATAPTSLRIRAFISCDSDPTLPLSNRIANIDFLWNSGAGMRRMSPTLDSGSNFVTK